MVSNGYGQGSPVVTVLYKVINSDSDRNGSGFNAFQMPAGKGLTLAGVKQ